MAFPARIQRIAGNGEDAIDLTLMPSMVGPYQPSLLRVLPGAAALLVGLAWVTGLVLLGGLAGRFGRLPFAADGDWIELHGHLGVVLALTVPAHLVATLRRGGWPLTTSIWSLRLHPNDGPAHWPAQVVRFLKRGPKI